MALAFRLVDNKDAQGDPTFCPRLLLFDRKGERTEMTAVVSG